MTANAGRITFERLPENWRRPPGCPRSTWIRNISEDLLSFNMETQLKVDLSGGCWLNMALRTRSGASSYWLSVCHKPVLCQNGWTDRALLGTEATLDLSYIVLKGNVDISKIRVLLSGTVSKTVDLETERLRYRSGSVRCAMFSETLSTAAQLYEKYYISKACSRQWPMTLKMTQGHRNCLSAVYCFLSISGL